MPPQGETIDDTVEAAPSIGDHLLYGLPTYGVGGITGAYAGSYYIGNFLYNSIANILGYSSYASGIASTVVGGVAGFFLGSLAIGGLLSLVSKGARKYFGMKGKPKEAKKATGSPG